MNWYYVENGQQAGPVNEEQMAQLRAAGRVLDQTLVWREGMADWKPWGEATGAPPVMGEVVCIECGKSFKLEEVVRVNGRFVCAACKPVHLQRLREGAVVAASHASGGTITEEELLARDYRVDLGSALDQAWRILGRHAGLMIGSAALVGLCFAAAWLVSVFLGFVLPLVNGLVLSAAAGPLMGGFTRLCLAGLRGQQPALETTFSGFKRQTGQLILCALIQGLITLACYLPVIVVAAVAGFAGVLGGSIGPAQFNTMGVGLIAGLVFALLFTICAIVYLTTLWTFSIALIADKGYRFWPAMRLSSKLVRKRWWMTFLFIFVAGLLNMLGAIVCGFGLLVSFPLYAAMKAALFEDNCRDLAPAWPG